MGHWTMETSKVIEVSYADDMVPIAKDEKSLNENLKVSRKSLDRLNMKIKQTKIKTMIL